MRRLLWPAITTVVMLAIAIGLGVWQIERLHWKQALLAQIDHAEQSPPVPLPADPSPFEKVSVTGQWRAGPSAYYGAEVRSTVTGPLIGAQVLTPLERPDGPPILVDRGWMAEPMALPAEPGPVTVIGYIRPSERASWMAPAADLPARRFWSLDPAAIGAVLGLPHLSPYTLVALGSGDALQPASALPRPPNDHLGYAITWFSLAACLVGVFAVFARRLLRS